jgi:hypothetical protein
LGVDDIATRSWIGEANLKKEPISSLDGQYLLKDHHLSIQNQILKNSSILPAIATTIVLIAIMKATPENDVIIK